MSTAPDSAWLRHLHEVIAPPAVSLWPPAPGWWLVIALVALIVLRFGQVLWQAWQRNGYRRQALHALADLPADNPAGQVIGCLTLLRQACLAIESPGVVARAQGADWVALLIHASAHDGGTRVNQRLHELLSTGAYCPPEQITPDDAARMAAFTRRWLQEHRA